MAKIGSRQRKFQKPRKNNHFVWFCEGWNCYWISLCKSLIWKEKASKWPKIGSWPAMVMAIATWFPTAPQKIKIKNKKIRLRRLSSKHIAQRFRFADFPQWSPQAPIYLSLAWQPTTTTWPSLHSSVWTTHSSRSHHIYLFLVICPYSSPPLGRFFPVFSSTLCCRPFLVYPVSG